MSPRSPIADPAAGPASATSAVVPCALLRCDNPEVFGCAAGEGSPASCPHFLASAGAGGVSLDGAARADDGSSSADDGSGQKGASAADAPAADVVVPWTGNALGRRALEFVAGAGPVRLVAVVGAPKSGKSTILAYLYLLLSRGCTLDVGAFAGSYTLQGWENLAADLRFSSWDHPRFPPHTAAGAGRVPGLLHVALRRPGERPAVAPVHVAFTDAPGEWFTRWAETPGAADAEGAAWIAAHATAFLVLADQAALAGPASVSGPALVQLQRLVERVRTAAAGRPVALVWSKADVAFPAERRARAERLLAAVAGDVPAFPVSVCPGPDDPDPDGRVLEAFGWACAQGPARGITLPDLTGLFRAAADRDRGDPAVPRDDGRAAAPAPSALDRSVDAAVALGAPFLSYGRP